MKIVLVTGGFDPIHSGHIAYFTEARALGDKLIVGLNSDAWLTRKKGRPFMPITERLATIENLKMVDHCILFDDGDESSVEAIRNVKMMFPDDEIIFANGGDRTADNIPEMTEKDVIFKFGIGGDKKKNSSSWILEEWRSPKTERPWGYYRVLHHPDNSVKLKELTINPNCSLSMQKHRDRSEFWFVTEGVASVYTINKSTDLEPIGMYKKHQHIWIPSGVWHQLANETTQPLRIVEIQYGDNCIEEDIERK